MKQNTFNSELFNIISKYTDIRFISTSFIGMIESSLSKNSEKNIHKANHFIIHFIHSHIIATILNNPNIKVIDIDDNFLNLMYLDNNLSLDTIKVFIDSLKMILNDYKCQSKKLSLQNNDFYKYVCEVSNQYFNFIPFSICFEYIMNYNHIVIQENFKNLKKPEGFDSTGIVTDFYSNTIFDLYGLFSDMKFLNDNNHISIFISNDKGFDYLDKLYQISILNKKFKFKYNVDLDYKLLHNDKYRHLFITK